LIVDLLFCFRIWYYTLLQVCHVLQLVVLYVAARDTVQTHEYQGVQSYVTPPSWCSNAIYEGCSESNDTMPLVNGREIVSCLWLSWIGILGTPHCPEVSERCHRIASRVVRI
jgi:hypothetical protein